MYTSISQHTFLKALNQITTHQKKNKKFLLYSVLPFPPLFLSPPFLSLTSVDHPLQRAPPPPNLQSPKNLCISALNNNSSFLADQIIPFSCPFFSSLSINLYIDFHHCAFSLISSTHERALTVRLRNAH